MNTLLARHIKIPTMHCKDCGRDQVSWCSPRGQWLDKFPWFSMLEKERASYRENVAERYCGPEQSVLFLKHLQFFVSFQVFSPSVRK